MSLSVIILTQDEAANITACIQSAAWADQIIIVDSGSTDQTVELARASNAEVLTHAWTNYSEQREWALRNVSSEWVYFIDADERSSPEQAAEIRACIQDPAIQGYWVPRHNYIMGKLTRGAGWYPDYQLRLLRREKAHYDLTRAVHELVILDGQAGHLTNPLIHYNYRDLRQFVQKQEKYTTYAALEMRKQGVRVKPQNYILQPIRHFIWRFFTLRGYRDGFHGFRLSLLMSWYEFKKYVKLRRAWSADR